MRRSVIFAKVEKNRSQNLYFNYDCISLCRFPESCKLDTTLSFIFFSSQENVDFF